MLERLYVDNFRCFVNFEWKPGRLALLLGKNGSGKTSILDVLWNVRELVVRGVEARRMFPGSSRTRWDTRLEQRVELDVRLEGELYKYSLVMEHSEAEPWESRVGSESLTCDDMALMEFDRGRLTVREGKSGAHGTLGVRTESSGLSALGPFQETPRLARFKKWFEEDVWYFRPDPRRMTGRTDGASSFLEVGLHNFASWYPSLVIEDLDRGIRIQEDLAEALPGFKSLTVDKARLQLMARFAGRKGKPYSVSFEDLSDGQRALIALYTLRHTVLKPGRLIIFDEPDNYVALREIQPWLMAMAEAADEEQTQVWFVSHHPEFLNQLAPSNGILFFRHEEGPSRIEPFQGRPGLNSAEVVARGWEESEPSRELPRE
ncbi:MAG: hypothetical protein EOO71_18440 [Myxococcaceae bacterium]|nr:MAG: hypothetical protein EOO71_18440 [Myxococcaceae bacterium]